MATGWSKHRSVFFKNNEPPYFCHFCGGIVEERLTVHHLDEDHSNDDPENLVPSHGNCHSRHHLKGKKRPEDVVRRIGLAHRGKVISEEHKDALRRANTGRVFSEETKRKLSESRKGKPGRKWTEEQKLARSNMLKGRPRTEAQKNALVGKPWSAARRAAQEDRRKNAEK